VACVRIGADTIRRPCAARNRPTLVITEGLLIYLDSDGVTGLARDLREVAQTRWWTACRDSVVVMLRQ